MFEKYTEKARVTIFFARYFANKCNAFAIEPEHILLGLIKADPKLFELLSPTGNDGTEIIKARLNDFLISKYSDSEKAPEDIPLSNESKKVLQSAYQQGVELNHTYIASEHLLLGLLKESIKEEHSFFSFKPKYFLSFLGQLLQDYGLTLEQVKYRVKDGSLTHQEQAFNK